MQVRTVKIQNFESGIFGQNFVKYSDKNPIYEKLKLDFFVGLSCHFANFRKGCQKIENDAKLRGKKS